jgi:hypothetical protein
MVSVRERWQGEKSQLGSLTKKVIHRSFSVADAVVGVALR